MAELTARFEGSILDRYFRFDENGTTLARDTIAGASTLVVMSYIIFANPSILGFVAYAVSPRVSGDGFTR